MADQALIVVADDFGRTPAYDAGILEAGRAGAIDAVSVLVTGDVDPAPLAGTGVACGLHLTLTDADAASEATAVAALRTQLGRFERLFGRPAAHLDGHRHCHAAPAVAAGIATEAARLELPVRSVTGSHRQTLRALGAVTADRLVGRFSERESLIPPALRRLLEEGGGAPAGITEWMVHPGYRDPGAGSSYDAGREEDLRLLLELAGRRELVAVRTTHAGAFSGKR